jgi:hypothetical protein
MYRHASTGPQSTPIETGRFFHEQLSAHATLEGNDADF